MNGGRLPRGEPGSGILVFLVLLALLIAVLALGSRQSLPAPTDKIVLDANGAFR